AEEQRLRPEVLRRLELDRRAVDEVGRVRRQLLGALADRQPRNPQKGSEPPAISAAEARAVRLAVLAAFPDRVARRREGDRRAVVLAAGGAAALGFEPSGEWMVAVDAEERRTGGRPGGVEIRLGSAIEPEWLIDLFPDRITEVDRRAFNPDTA